MERQLTLEELSRKVRQQEDTVAQLVRIIAATNHRISDLKVKQETMENNLVR